jgi:hypothetical protein
LLDGVALHPHPALEDRMAGDRGRRDAVTTARLAGQPDDSHVLEQDQRSDDRDRVHAIPQAGLGAARADSRS